MRFRAIKSSIKSYKIASTIAIALLLLLSSISYKQNKALKKSAELVSKSLMIDKEINTLFSYFSLIEALEYKALILKDTTFFNTYIDYKKQSKTSLLNLTELTKDIPEQHKYLDSINLYTDSLEIAVTKLNTYHNEPIVEKAIIAELDNLSSILNTINSFKISMINNKEALLKERKATYKTETFLTPFFSLFLVVFALIVFIIAFIKINNDSKKLLNTQAFIDKIISNSNNIITYLEPVKDADNKIIDFRIDYANNKISEQAGKTIEQVIGKNISEIFPTLFTNGVFEIYVKCVTTGEPQHYQKEYHFNNKNQWFSSTTSKLATGVIITTVDVTKERKSKEDLSKLNSYFFEKNTILNNAETLAKIGSYSWYVTTNTIELSENFYKLLGFAPNEFESNFENFKNFIHPDDLVKYQTKNSQALKNKHFKDFIYRVINKEGKVRYWRTTGEFIIENGNEKIVGIVQDVTESIKTDIKLRKKNKALKRSNAELESFNRVVSHDLQEPLRKIQMFISILSEAEADYLSNQNRVYFDKIDNAASRMQLLIKNLLSYSRIDSTHENFETIDLNKKLEKVEDNLSARILETNLKIIKKNLPTIQGIPFQMEQLFNNLLSNAIKYRDLNKDSKILIDASIVHKDQIPLPDKKTSKNYHKIVVSDNGIGFDQENAKKIFDIFERLHQKSAYSGTGVGLAICKKIVENHHGFIYATGEHQKGAIFYIYLPIDIK
ncbi:ATP-binding protein [Algibacter pacificus]|uniref:ATP-binding protein n=1 Tax=Algibacter pacificus TaxID=2599389 RepID=UPI0011C8D388|nr:ATP-binding protein [Algibacter pacificus]